ncbi:MAG: ornithine carbamoyltransferase [Nitrospinaceae bacterium]|nr:MAG: ornithine carbamoyltransferase [Nitrospinaceae bacterium]
MKKDLLSINDFSQEEILGLLEKSAQLKKMRVDHVPHEPLKGKSLGMIFSKHSTRTRISFEVGMFELGGQALFLTTDQLQITRGETVEDSAKVLSRYLDGIVIRTYDHEEVVNLAKHATIPVINGLTDLNHPVQILSDLFTIYEKLGKVKKVKVAYVGDGNNVVHSWMVGASVMDMHLTVACPKNFQPQRPSSLGPLGKIEILEDPLEAVQNADVIYTDVWVSMGQEKESEEKIKQLKRYQINQNLVNAANDGVLVMHCLPAHREMEISSEVMDGKNSIVFDQAENRLHMEKAILEALLTHSRQ